MYAVVETCLADGSVVQVDTYSDRNEAVEAAVRRISLESSATIGQLREIFNTRGWYTYHDLRASVVRVRNA